MNPFEVLWEYRKAFINGYLVTIELVVITCIFGTLFGFLFEIISRYTNRIVRKFIDILAFGLSSIPALVILFWLYYPAQEIFNITLSSLTTAIIALVLINSFAVYRIAADSLHEFPKQYLSTGKVCGMNRWKIIKYIQGPLLFRAIIPRWLDQQVVILQTSVFASLISVEEIFRVSQRINSVIYQPVLIYTSMAIVFLITAGSTIFLASFLRKKYARDFSER